MPYHTGDKKITHSRWGADFRIESPRPICLGGRGAHTYTMYRRWWLLKDNSSRLSRDFVQIYCSSRRVAQRLHPLLHCGEKMQQLGKSVPREGMGCLNPFTAKTAFESHFGGQTSQILSNLPPPPKKKGTAVSPKITTCCTLSKAGACQ